VTASPRLRRSLQWGLVLAAAAVALSVWYVQTARPDPASERRLRITLVGQDRDTLACALNRAIEGYRCEFRAPQQRWPAAQAPALEERLAPYVTTRRNLLLAAGLFAQPEVKERYQQYVERQQSGSQPKRFEAECRLRLLQVLDQVLVRFAARGRFSLQKRVSVVEPHDCRVFEVED
jgi:hypothetical protein